VRRRILAMAKRQTGVTRGEMLTEFARVLKMKGQPKNGLKAWLAQLKKERVIKKKGDGRAARYVA
jgi:hypothetical protein